MNEKRREDGCGVTMVNKANKKKGRLERAPPSSASPPEPKEDAEAEEEFAWDETAPLEVMPEHDGYDEEDDGLDGVESKKKGGSKKVSKGTFQSLNLSKPIFSGIMRMGYKLPTPVQRKSLPEALAGKDIVCMARTGSGKTAAFLIPVLERLQAHSSRVGARALVLSPTRELAMQTVKFAKGLSKFTDLRVALLVGGDSMEDQFEALAHNPDIIIGTPGRVMHHLQEVPDFSLSSVQVVVYDEADRLFEMGFAEQLNAIMKSIPEERQTLLFSATLPKMLAQFARAGLRDPMLIRLDIDTKISEQLGLAFFTVRAGNKTAALLHLLREVLPKDKLTIIFAPTKHHVEFLNEVLTQVGLPCSAIFGSMDFEARKLALERFRLGRVKYLVVTDVAARGIDVPLLDYVINYSFPPASKLFVHRVGRAARQGRSGAAFSLLELEELPWMVELHLFLGRKIENVVEPGGYKGYKLEEMTPQMVHYGNMPQHVMDRENESLRLLMERNGGALANMWRVCENAMKQYRRTRPDPSRNAIHRAKELNLEHVHPLLLGTSPDTQGGSVEDLRAKDDLVKHLQGFRPAQTVLETSKADAGSAAAQQAQLAAGGKKKRKRNQLLLTSKEDVGTTVMRNIRKEHSSVLKRNNVKPGGSAKQQEEQNGGREAAVQQHEEDDRDAEEQDEDDREEEQEEEGEEGQGADAGDKPRLSRAARRLLKKKRRVSGGDAPGLTQPPPQQPKPKKALRDFREPGAYIDYGVTEYEKLVEDQLQPRSIVKDREMLVANRLEEAMLDMQPDEAMEMAKKQRITKWDARKKKFVRTTVAELAENRGKHKIRTESGVLVKSKALPKGEMYEKWKKRTHRSLGVAGAEEDGGDDAGDDDEEGGAGGRRKQRGGGQDDVDQRFMGFKKYRHTSNRLTQVDTQVPGRKAKEELKNVMQIKKERMKKAKEKERLMRKKNKGGGGGGGGGKGGKKGGGKPRGKGGRGAKK